MGKSIAAAAFILCAPLALFFALGALLYQGMIYFHFLFVDYKDPDGRGLKGVIVTTPEFLRDLVIAMCVLTLVAMAWRSIGEARSERSVKAEPVADLRGSPHREGVPIRLLGLDRAFNSFSLPDWIVGQRWGPMRKDHGQLIPPRRSVRLRMRRGFRDGADGLRSSGR